MTEEQKQLLLIDLSARLPYGVKCCIKNNHKVCGILNGIVGENIHLYSSGCSTYNIGNPMADDFLKDLYDLINKFKDKEEQP